MKWNSNTTFQVCHSMLCLLSFYLAYIINMQQHTKTPQLHEHFVLCSLGHWSQSLGLCMLLLLSADYVIFFAHATFKAPFGVFAWATELSASTDWT